MRNTHAQKSEVKTRLILAAITVAVMIVPAGSKENEVRGAGSGPVPRVTAITKITHDGYRKASLLADDSQLYVTELPAANRVIAKVSLAKSEVKTRLILAAITVAVMIVPAGSKENEVRGAGSGPVPRVTAITKITHDGYRKASLLADDSQLYVTELPAANRVIAKVSLAK